MPNAIEYRLVPGDQLDRRELLDVIVTFFDKLEPVLRGSLADYRFAFSRKTGRLDRRVRGPMKVARPRISVTRRLAQAEE